MISRRLGTAPEATIAATVAPASRGVANSAAPVRGFAAAGRRASVASVITPRVPPLPPKAPGGPPAAEEERGEVVPRHALDGPPAGAQHLAGREHDLQAEHVVRGDAVL